MHHRYTVAVHVRLIIHENVERRPWKIFCFLKGFPPGCIIFIGHVSGALHIESNIN